MWRQTLLCFKSVFFPEKKNKKKDVSLHNNNSRNYAVPDNMDTSGHRWLKMGTVGVGWNLTGQRWVYVGFWCAAIIRLNVVYSRWDYVGF